jgi:crossover junction endodeoxyribonuclease RusA
MIVLELPYPPSVNHYWRRVGHRTLISKEGRLFRKRVLTMLSVHCREPLAGRLHVRVLVYPPDRRRRDLDNIIKALLDALEHGGVYENDSQIDRLTIERGEVFKGGKAIVEITEVHPS